MIGVAFMLSTALAGAGHSLSAAPHQTAVRVVRVYVFADETDVSDLRAWRESVKDLRAALAGKKKDLGVVDTREEADVIIEVVDRSVTIPRVVFGPSARPGQLPDPRSSGLARVVHLRVTLTYRGDPMTFTNKNTPLESNGGWRSAADDVAKQVDKWIVEHRSAIVGGQAIASPPRQAP